MPFKGATVAELKNAILDGHFAMPDYLSSQCADLIAGILKRKADWRLTLQQVSSVCLSVRPSNGYWILRTFLQIGIFKWNWFFWGGKSKSWASKIFYWKLNFVLDHSIVYKCTNRDVKETRTFSYLFSDRKKKSCFGLQPFSHCRNQHFSLCYKKNAKNANRLSIMSPNFQENIYCLTLQKLISRKILNSERRFFIFFF